MFAIILHSGTLQARALSLLSILFKYPYYHTNILIATWCRIFINIAKLSNKFMSVMSTNFSTFLVFKKYIKIRQQ